MLSAIRIHAFSCTCGWFLARVRKNARMFVTSVWCGHMGTFGSVLIKFQLLVIAAVCLFPFSSMSTVCYFKMSKIYLHCLHKQGILEVCEHYCSGKFLIELPFSWTAKLQWLLWSGVTHEKSAYLPKVFLRDTAHIWSCHCFMSCKPKMCLRTKILQCTEPTSFTTASKLFFRVQYESTEKVSTILL